MKVLFISLLFLNFTSLSAQNNDYLNSVNAQNNLQQIKQLQKKAANFNIFKLESFEKNAETTYQVTFENPNGKLVATYDRTGIILKTVEEYKDVKSPKQVTINVLKSHPDWMVEGNIYKIGYSSVKKSTKTLEVLLKKGKETEIVLFNLSCRTNEILYAKN